MATYQFDLPLDSDVEPCPMACGGMTEDPYGGPCQRCWDKAPRGGEEPLNDIEATGHCCCAGCIGMGPCDLDQNDEQEDDDDA